MSPVDVGPPPDTVVPPKVAHWLIAVANVTGLLDRPLVNIGPLTSAADVWERICDEAELTGEELAIEVASYFRIGLANLNGADPRARRLVTEGLARRHLVFPLLDNGRHLVVATCDPTDLIAEKTLAFASARNVVFEIAPPGAIQRMIEQNYSSTAFVEHLLANSDTEGVVEIDSLDDYSEAVDESEAEAEPVVRLVNVIIRDAIQHGASDIHLQPEGFGGVVRLRVDGVLRPYMQLPVAAMTRVVARIKVMGDMDIADRYRPQDGRARVRIDGARYDLRISTVPTRRAEKAVLRVLDQAQTVGGLDDVGLTTPELIALRRALTARDGIIIVTGPTGSGKTTTLYSAIRELSDETVNIMTVEDPIEYEMAGITQIQIEPRRGVTFAKALRAILRQDPDIVLVGEIRDAETASIAVKAAMTGHLVLTTLHTNDAISAIRRLVDIGVERSAIADTVRAILAQRLVRLVCGDCKEGRTRSGAACTVCAGTGYRGRRPLVEVFEPDGGLRSLMVQGAPLAEIAHAADERGMRTLGAVAVELVEAGVTDQKEVARVLGTRGIRREVETQPLVMVVDEVDEDRLLSCAFLEQAGFRVTEARNGVEALAELDRTPGVALVVADLTMPRMGGLELTERIRSTPACALTPVVVLTESTDPGAEVALLDAGADDYLKKPIDQDHFLARIRAAMRRTGSVA